MWLARKFTRAAFAEIGEYFGRRSHSTVISAQNKVEHWLVDGGKSNWGPAIAMSAMCSAAWKPGCRQVEIFC